MAMGKRRARQQELWIATAKMPRSQGHLFYDRVNAILQEEGFEGFAEKECLRFYASSEKSVGERARHRAVSMRNRRSFLQVESNELC